MSRRALLFSLALAALLPAIAVGLSAQSKSAWSGVYTTEQADRGRRLYVRECAQCHGPTLMGAEGGTELVGEAVLARWQKGSVGELFDLIRKTMPEAAPGSLTNRQYADVLSYLLKENAFPTGTEELPPTRDALDAMSFAKP